MNMNMYTNKAAEQNKTKRAIQVLSHWETGSICRRLVETTLSLIVVAYTCGEFFYLNSVVVLLLVSFTINFCVLE